MGVVTVLYGYACDGKNEQAFGRCLKKLRQREAATCLYLVRSEVRARRLRERIVRELGGCFAMPVHTFPDYIKQLYRQTTMARRVLSSLEQKLLLEDVFRQLERERGRRFYLNGFRDHPGILAKVHEFINGVRQAGIASAYALQTALHTEVTAGRPALAELVEIFSLYEHRLNTARVTDESGVFLQIARLAAAGQLNLRDRVQSPELLVLEGYYAFTTPEQQIFTALSAQFEYSFLALDAPLNPYTALADAELPKPLRLFRKLLAYIRTAGLSVRPTRSRISPKRQRIAEAFLGLNADDADREARTEQAETRDTALTVTAYHDRCAEVTEIARSIRQLARDQSITALREVGVTFPVVEEYEHLIREIFPLFGLPFTMFQGCSLAATAAVTTISRLLDVVLDDYSRDALQRLFASPLVRFETPAPDDTAEDAPLALDQASYPQLDALAAALGIVSGKAAWLDALQQAQTAVTPTPNADSPLPTELSRLLPTACDLFEFLAALETPQPCAPDVLIDRLLKAMYRFQIPQHILHAPQRDIRESEAVAFRAFCTLLETVKQNGPSAATAHAHPLTLSEFDAMLRVAIRDERYYPPTSPQDSVFVMGRLDTRQVQFSHLFFGGLVERDFPGRENPDIFLTEAEAERLGLPTALDHFQEADYLFYLNLLNPTKHLHLSYPVQEGESDLLRATYIDKVLQCQKADQNATDSALSDEPTNLNLAPAETDHPALEDVFTYSELYQWLARHSLEEAALAPVLQFITTAKGADAVARFQHGLDAQQRRTAEELTCFEGILTSRFGTQFTADRYAGHIYAVSEFDQYVRCPIRYFFQRLLRVEPAPQPPTELTGLVIGTVLHRILYRFYTGESHNAAGAGMSDREFLARKAAPAAWVREAKERMKQIAHEELAEYNGSGVFWQQFTTSLLAGLNANDAADDTPAPGLLAAFIEAEANEPDRVVPTYLEAHFGRPTRPEETRPQYVAEDAGYVLSFPPYRLRAADSSGRPRTIRLRGQIDRIDVESEPAGPDNAKRRVVLYDYKTGAGIPSAQQIRDGLAFQLPLYLLAAQALLGDDYEVIAGGYYQVRSPHDLGKKRHCSSKEVAKQGYLPGSTRSLLETHADFLQLLDEYKHRTVWVAEQVQAGRFPPTLLGPQKAGCGFCDYRQICRVDHQRLKTHAAAFTAATV